MKTSKWLVAAGIAFGALTAPMLVATTQEQKSCTVNQVVVVGSSYAHIRCQEPSPGETGSSIFYFAVAQSDPRLEQFLRMGQTALLSGRKMVFSYVFEKAGETTCNAKDCRTAINFGLF